MEHIVKNVRMLYENVVARLLVESKTDSFAREIVKGIIAASKERMARINVDQSLKLVNVLPWPVGTKAPAKELKVVLKISVKKGPGDLAMVAGTWYAERSMMYIDVNVRSTDGKLRQEHLSLIQAKAYDTVRHELEHAAQDTDKLMAATEAHRNLMTVPGTMWNDPDAMAEYFLSPAEVEAFVAGMYHAAKRERVPFIKVVDRLINQLVRVARSKGASASETLHVLDKVRTRWLDYASTRFPKAILRH